MRKNNLTPFTFKGFSKLNLETGLEDVCVATVNWGWCFTIFNLGVDIVKHKTGFLVEIPVQAGREIKFFSAPDSRTVQVYIREPRRQLPRPPFALQGMEIMLWLQTVKSTTLSAIISMFARNEVAAKQIKSPEIRVAQRFCILEDMKILPLEGEGTMNRCKFRVDKICRVRNKFARIYKSIVRKARLRTRPELRPDILTTTKLVAVRKAQVEKPLPIVFIPWKVSGARGGLSRVRVQAMVRKLWAIIHLQIWNPWFLYRL